MSSNPAQSASPLFQPTSHGLPLANRIAMAPMTRSRAPGNVPNVLMREYYAQRNGAGLVITEGTSPSPSGLGYARIPGLFNEAQAAGWGGIAKAVQAGGAKFFVQLMHTGRIGHAGNLPAGARVLAPSAIAAAGKVWTDTKGMQPHPVPEAFTADELAATRDEFANAARLGVAAGIDGVELHAANGYLLEQFLNPASNQRTDAYGGSPENRRRFVLETVDATIAAVGAGRVGIRISPFGTFNDQPYYEGIEDNYLALARELSARGIAYLHLIATPGVVPEAFVDAVRAAFTGTLILAGDYDRPRAEADIASGRADLIAFGRPFIGNPDLPRRLLLDAPLAGFDAGSLYTADAKGYTDYPALATEAA
jgi:N-ethylmaleimide reductase